MPIDVQAIYIFLKYNSSFIDFSELNFRGFGNGKIMLQAQDIPKGWLGKSNYVFKKDLLHKNCVWIVEQLSLFYTTGWYWHKVSLKLAMKISTYLEAQDLKASSCLSTLKSQGRPKKV